MTPPEDERPPASEGGAAGRAPEPEPATPGAPQPAEPEADAAEHARQSIAVAAGIIAAVAKNTALEVDGVAGLAATLPERVKSILGAGFAGVVVEFLDDETARIDLHLIGRNGVPLPPVADQVRRTVREKIERVSGVRVADVAVHFDQLARDEP